MAHTIPFRLQKAAHEFQAGDSTGFGIRCGIKARDPSTKQDVWTNYECALFAKTEAAISFYRANLIEGALAVVSGENLIIKTFDGQQGQQITLALTNARLEAVTTGRAPDAAQQAYQQGAQQPAQQPQQHAAGFDDFHDDQINF
jgi:single-strand DNA-binding protein